MTIPAKYQYIAGGVLIITAFAFGRFSVQKPTVKTQMTQQTNQKKDQKSDTHKQIVIVDQKQSNGAETKTTTINEVKDSDTTTNTQSQTQIKQTVTPPKTQTLNISVLGTEDFSKGLNAPTYGISVNKEVLGPVTVGAFGLMSGVVGVSIGLDF